MLLGGCGFGPRTAASPELILNSPEREEEIGRSAAEQVRREIGLVEDPALLAYLDDLGQLLARHARGGALTRFRFHVVDMEEPNAFALPGGYIFVSRGLLTLANTEDELACVIGHEIGHVVARHAAQRELEQARVGMISLLGMVAAAILGGAQGAAAVAGVSQGAGASIIAAYSRDQEHDADRIGQELAARAGWDPSGMATFLRSLENATRLREGATRLPSFFDSHPPTPDRVATTASRADTLRGAWSPKPARRELLARTRGLLVGPNPAEGVFHGQRFLHTDLDLTLRFPARWQTVNRHDRVGAIAPGHDAVLTLELQAQGEDPARAALAYTVAHEILLERAEPLRIGALRAYRGAARVDGGRRSPPAFVEFTWIAYGGRIYRLAGAAPRAKFREVVPQFRRTAQSFRPLSDEERANVTEVRLEVVPAQANESLFELSKRTGNVWSLDETQVANSVFHVHEALGAGQLVKVAVARPYAGQSPDAEADPASPLTP